MSSEPLLETIAIPFNICVSAHISESEYLRVRMKCVFLLLGRVIRIFAIQFEGQPKIRHSERTSTMAEVPPETLPSVSWSNVMILAKRKWRKSMVSCRPLDTKCAMRAIACCGSKPLAKLWLGEAGWIMNSLPLPTWISA